MRSTNFLQKFSYKCRIFGMHRECLSLKMVPGAGVEPATFTLKCGFSFYKYYTKKLYCVVENQS